MELTRDFKTLDELAEENSKISIGNRSGSLESGKQVDKWAICRYFLDPAIYIKREVNQRMSPQMYYNKNIQTLSEQFPNPKTPSGESLSSKTVSSKFPSSKTPSGEISSSKTMSGELIYNKVMIECGVNLKDSTYSLILVLRTLFKVKSVLDINCIWGQSMLGCWPLVEDKIPEYVGFDPYLLAAQEYAEMKAQLGAGFKGRFVVVPQEYDGKRRLIADPHLTFFDISRIDDDGKICDMLSTAWLNMSSDRYLCVKIPAEMIKKETMILDLVTRCFGMRHEKYVDLGLIHSDPGAIAHIWMKGSEMQTETFSSQLKHMNDNIISLGDRSLISRGLELYSRKINMKEKYAYVAIGEDPILREIVNLRKSLEERIRVYYIRKGSKQDSEYIHFLNKHFEVIQAESEEKVMVEIKGKYILIPRGLEDPVFEACLAIELKKSTLSDGSFDNLPVVWVKTNYPVVVRALMSLWKNTLFYVCHTFKGTTIKSSLPMHKRKNVLLYWQQDNAMRLTSIRSEVGYPSDFILG